MAQPLQWVEQVAVQPAAWRQACAAELEAGGRFCGAHASGPGRWSAMFARGSGTRALVTEPRGAELDSVVDLAPGAQWDEREAHDEFGLRFAGHEPSRPLLAHTDATAAWTVPVEGRGVHQVAVGPVHAGVIESGHFRFHVVGERILHLDPKLFYKRRGLERAAAGRELGSALAYAARACGACSVSNSVAYAQACEVALGLVADRELRRARTLLLELERLYNHLHDVAAICAGVGFAPGNMIFAALKERALRIDEGLTGHRFLFGAVRFEESRIALEAGPAANLRARLRELRTEFAAAWPELHFAASVGARLDGVGVLDLAQAARLGAVGPAARAAGLGWTCAARVRASGMGRSSPSRRRGLPPATSPLAWSCARLSWRRASSCSTSC